MKIKRICNLCNCAVLCDTQEKSDAIIDFFHHTPNMEARLLQENPWLIYKEKTCYFFSANHHIGVMHKNSVCSTRFELKNFEEMFELEDESESETETAEEAYKRGLNDMHEAIKTIYFKETETKMTADDYIKCFGDGVSFKTLLLKYSAEEIINKLNDYFESKAEIKPYDEVFCEDEDQWLPGDNDGDYGVVLSVVHDTYIVLMKNGNLVTAEKGRLRKTGRTIPITNVLDSISTK